MFFLKFILAVGGGVGCYAWEVSINSAASTAKISAALGSVGQGSGVSEVAERLLAYFTSGDIAVGTRLPAERQLAASLGVGRSAVREALAALEILGIVIVRPGSGTYGRWLSFDLDGDRQNSIFIPAGCAHGFQSLTEPADTSYRIDRPHDPSEDLTIAYDDPQLGIQWPLQVTAMSAADATAPPLSELTEELRRVTATA